MKKILLASAASMMLLTVAAEAQAQILVTNSSGGQSDITGTWVTKCYPGDPATSTFDMQYMDAFSGSNTYTVTEYEYATTNGSCGGTGTERGAGSGTFTFDGDFAAAGWFDINGVAAPAPLNQAGTASLSATPTGSQLTVTYTTATGTMAPKLNLTDTFSPYVDETVASRPVFYYMMMSATTGTLKAHETDIDYRLPDASNTPAPIADSGGGGGCLVPASTGQQVWLLPLLGVMMCGILLFRRKES